MNYENFENLIERSDVCDSALSELLENSSLVVNLAGNEIRGHDSGNLFEYNPDSNRVGSYAKSIETLIDCIMFDLDLMLVKAKSDAKYSGMIHADFTYNNQRYLLLDTLYINDDDRTVSFNDCDYEIDEFFYAGPESVWDGVMGETNTSALGIKISLSNDRYSIVRIF